MKHLKTFALITSTLLLVACGKHDQAYYSDHMEDAEKKALECKEDLNEALFSGEFSKAKDIKLDEECNAAIFTVQEHERIEKEKIIKEQTDKINKKLSLDYKGLDWKQSLVKYLNEPLCHGYHDDSVECKVGTDFYNKQVKIGTEELKKLSFDQLTDDSTKKEYCLKDQRDGSPCTVWKEYTSKVALTEFKKQDIETLLKNHDKYCAGTFLDPICEAHKVAYSEKSDQLVEEYVKNYDKLKADYNMCYERFHATIDPSKQAKIALNYPCIQVRDAKIILHTNDSDYLHKME